MCASGVKTSSSSSKCLASSAHAYRVRTSSISRRSARVCRSGIGPPRRVQAQRVWPAAAGSLDPMEHLGLVGLPESGHAGVFAALTGHDATNAADRVLGVVPIPDERLDRLAAMSKSKNVVRASFQVAMLPALSTEAGKGMGSRLLGSLRDCDALLSVVRAGDGHDPARELTALEEELILADLGSVEARLYKQRRAAKGDKSLVVEI